MSVLNLDKEKLRKLCNDFHDEIWDKAFKEGVGYIDIIIENVLTSYMLEASKITTANEKSIEKNIIDDLKIYFKKVIPMLIHAVNVKNERRKLKEYN